MIGVPLFDASTNSDGKGIDALIAVEFAADAQPQGPASPARPCCAAASTVRTGPQAHQLADKSKAMSDCRTCHRAGSQAFQSVTISLVGPDGRRVGYGANADVLNSAFSVDSISGLLRDRRHPHQAARYPARSSPSSAASASPSVTSSWAGCSSVSASIIRTTATHPIRRPAATALNAAPERQGDGIRNRTMAVSTFTRCRSASGTGPTRSASS